MTEGNKPGGGHANREDEPIRLKRDTDLSPEPAQPAHAPRQEWHRRGPEPMAYIPEDTHKPLTPQKPATILDAFRFPFSLAGVIHFLIFLFGPFLLLFFPRVFFFGEILIIGVLIALFGYLYYYLSCCIIAAAKDEHLAPDVSFEETPNLPDLLRRVLLIIGSALICFGPAIIYMFYFFISARGSCLIYSQTRYTGFFSARASYFSRCFYWPW